MSTTVIYECPKCEDRTLVQHTQEGLHPEVWCDCDDFTIMEPDYIRKDGETTHDNP